MKKKHWHYTNCLCILALSDEFCTNLWSCWIKNFGWLLAIAYTSSCLIIQICRKRHRQPENAATVNTFTPNLFHEFQWELAFFECILLCVFVCTIRPLSECGNFDVPPCSHVILRYDKRPSKWQTTSKWIYWERIFLQSLIASSSRCIYAKSYRIVDVGTWELKLKLKPETASFHSLQCNWSGAVNISKTLNSSSKTPLSAWKLIFFHFKFWIWALIRLKVLAKALLTKRRLQKN